MLLVINLKFQNLENQLQIDKRKPITNKKKSITNRKKKNQPQIENKIKYIDR